jgi:6-phosphogluconolactonase
MTYCFPTVNELSEKLSIDFLHFIAEASPGKETCNIAFSGGATPRAFFEKIAVNQYNMGRNISWDMVHLFWVDERCVPPNDAESNFGMTNECLLRKIVIAESNVHRIQGENNPYQEVTRYTDEIKLHVKFQHGIPAFDWIFLGIGDDGHTASIFPNRPDLLTAESICDVVKHPVTGQYRVTLTGKPILQTKRLTFLVTGESKSLVIRHIVNNEPEALHYPAAYINLRKKDADWYLDEAAAKYLKS